MGLLAKLSQLVRGPRKGLPRPHRSERDAPRRCRFESMEPREMLNADPLQFGAVYIEEDIGSDLHGDAFHITFEGGAPGTELTRLVIDGDQGQPGFGENDIFFDTQNSGFGADNSLPFTLVSLSTQDPAATVNVTVVDGQSQMILDLVGFQAGDKLIFGIDVDEVEDFDPAETDPILINDGFDPITSGVEFQGSNVTAHFAAPHYHESLGTAEFRNRYDDSLAGRHLNLPADDDGGKRDRSAGAVLALVQQPLPVSLSGTVYLETDLDLVQDPGEAGLPDVSLSLFRMEGSQYVFTGHTATTAADGGYKFGVDLQLTPGTYQVRETQPSGLFSVGALPGSVAGNGTGMAMSGNPDVLTAISIPLGDQHAIDFDFAEALPAEVSGYVYHDRSDDGARDTGEEGLAGVDVRVLPLDTVAAQSPVVVTTDANGYYEATGLAPGMYRIVEAEQPAGYFDGSDAAGTVAGGVVGAALNPGDRIENVRLGGGQAGIEYNFGEIAPASIRGHVGLAGPDGDCFGDQSSPLSGVTVQLLDANGNLLQQTKTDAQGEYAFIDLLPGSYTVVEVTPAGLIDGGERVGTVDGLAVGQVTDNDTVAAILLGSGQAATDYDFCENEPASISGFVYHDADNDGVFDASEGPLANVLVSLLDEQGRVLDQRPTDTMGYYEFTMLRAGTYSVAESQPDGWVDGLDAPGRIAGTFVGSAVNPGDRIDAIQLKWGDAGTHYDFGELRPVTISGCVFHDRANDGRRDAGDEGIAAVRIDVTPVDTMAAQSTVTVLTDENGCYEVTGLAPGTYRIVESQPANYVDGTDLAGTVDGQAVGTATNPGDAIEDIFLASGQTGRNYDFGEYQRASIAGNVFLSAGDCFSADAMPLPGATVELRDGDGRQVAQTATNAQGGYLFSDLLPGTYRVVETTPLGLMDGGERLGTVNGQTLGSIEGDDTLGQIVLTSGQQAVDYDFCEHPPGSIAGNVYHDANDNGLLDTGESPIAGVTVVLRDDLGQIVSSEKTGQDGSYRFDGLHAGRYSLTEVHPAGWLDGRESVGTIDGSREGDAAQWADSINAIDLGWGDEGIHYDFGELLPGSLTGVVHVDPNQNCVFDAGEMALADVTIRLYDAAGDLVATTQTDGSGRYRFEGLVPGVYSVVETQPTGYFQGGQRAGSQGGDTSQVDQIRLIYVGSDQHLTDYDFCEVPPASLAGRVHLDLNRNCELDPWERGIGGVTIQLLGQQNEVVATTVTDAKGNYLFDDLAPGVYSVRESQPAGYFHGCQRSGSAGGEVVEQDLIGAVPVRAGQHLTNYDFAELPPARLSGYVFQDGQAITTPDGTPPENLEEIRDGLRTADDTPLPGVVIELRDGLSGEPIDASEALPGTYAAGPIRAVTDANGYYEFSGLPGGRSYAVYQAHPRGYVDGIDTPGTTKGLAFNPGHPVSLFVIAQLIKHPGNDAIVRIPLGIGASSAENNFSEVRVERQPVLPFTPPQAATPQLPDVHVPPWISVPVGPVGLLPPPRDATIDGGSGAIGGDWTLTWHLSVIDAGMPRDASLAQTARSEVWMVTTFLETTNWQAERMRGGRWLLSGSQDATQADEDDPLRHYLFGIYGAVPVVGDFNGDGLSELGVYYQGEWFIDLNGNGRWDEEDLWARLGTETDLPVVGDWDGDGKDDIGIFGPEWAGDPRAIEAEPGLPDLSNPNKEKPKNLPPQPEEATDGHRLLKLKVHGPQRADLIDHVFRFGSGRDRPVTGDWNGDGIRTIGVFQDGRWRLDVDGDGQWTDRDAEIHYGKEGDRPVVGDFDGDGIEELGVYRNGTWLLDSNGNRELDAHDRVFELGGAADEPVVGDWNGDGTDQPGVYSDANPPNNAPPAE